LRIGFHFLLMVFIALLTGIGLSYFALADGGLFGAYRINAWTAWPQAGSPNPDPYTRAFVARSGALQLGSAEGIQFVASRDSEGQLLQRTCNYRLMGTTPVASFWTLRAVATNGRSTTPRGSPQNLQSNRLSRTNIGAAILQVGPELAPQNWLEIEGEGPFDLILTLYDASIFAGFGSTISELPTITNKGCS